MLTEDGKRHAADRGGLSAADVLGVRFVVEEFETIGYDPRSLMVKARSFLRFRSMPESDALEVCVPVLMAKGDDLFVSWPEEVVTISPRGWAQGDMNRDHR